MDEQKVQTAIERIRTAAEISQRRFDKPLMVMYSGGKDSDVIVRLAIESGVNFCVRHNFTTADAPETVRYLRKRIQWMCDCGIDAKINYPEKSLWKLIVEKKWPPTRFGRYCCGVLKERKEKETFICTGVRWAESWRRESTRGNYERLTANKLILRNDNDVDRRLFERCHSKATAVVNPVIDWEDVDVWNFLKNRNIKVCPLYKEGKCRIGCIGCPMTGKKERLKHFERWPKYRKMWANAFGRMLKKRIEDGDDIPESWTDSEAIFNWWISC